MTDTLTLNIGPVSITVDSEWFANEGQRWSFDTLITASHNGKIAQHDAIRTSRPFASEIWDALTWLAEEIDHPIKTDIDSARDIQCWIFKQADKTAPHVTPADDYYGL